MRSDHLPATRHPDPCLTLTAAFVVSGKLDVDRREVMAVGRQGDAGDPSGQVPGWALRAPRRYFEVICGRGGSYVLFQDLQLGTWHMSR